MPTPWMSMLFGPLSETISRVSWRDCALAGEKQVPIDPYKDNLLVDGHMNFAPVAENEKGRPRKVP